MASDLQKLLDASNTANMEYQKAAEATKKAQATEEEKRKAWVAADEAYRNAYNAAQKS